MSAHLSQAAAYRRSHKVDQQIISRMSLPGPVLETYHRCDPPPALNELNTYRDDDKISLKFYTDPDYFFRLWVEDMTQRTAEVQQKKKKKKKNRGKRRQPADKKQVARVQKKEYSAMGAEFAEPVPAPAVPAPAAPAPATSAAPAPAVTESIYMNVKRPTGAPPPPPSKPAGAPPPPPSKPAGAPPPPPPVGAAPPVPSGAPPPPPPVAHPAMPPPPPPATSHPVGMPPPPPMPAPAFGAPPPPALPSAPKPALTPKTAQPPPPPPPPVASPAPPPPPPPPATSLNVGGTNDLLQAIRSKQLRKVTRERVNTASRDEGVAAILMRRVAVEGSDSEDSDSGEEWDDDDDDYDDDD